MTAPTDSPAAPAWPTCQAVDGCGGIRVGGHSACLAHLEESQLADWLATLRPGSDLDLRGTQVEANRLARLLTALHDEHGRPRLGDTWFGRAQFSGDAIFSRAQFSGDTIFSRAQFSGPAMFDGAQFSRDAWFSEAQFSRPARFSGAQFSRPARFSGAQFSGDAWFDGAQFSRDAWFDGAQFGRPAWFDGAQFSRDAIFSGAQFSGPAWFDGAQFSGRALLDGAQFSGDAMFEAARFARPAALGPLLVRGTLWLASASFEATLMVEAVAARVRMERATCTTGISLQLRYAEVTLDGVQLAQSMTVAAADPFTWTTDSGPAGFDETAFAQPGRSPTPRLLSVRATDVANLVVTDLSLAPCHFASAHHLDHLRLEGAIGFAQPPRGLRVGLAWPPVWWWTRRQTLAEEHTWRAIRPKGAGWHGRDTQAPAWLDTQAPAWLEETTGPPPRVIGPERLAGLYRALRQAQEDRKNEPGAADFYYGEMEMRRLAASTPWAERVILFAYWLVAGYGLRSLRALAALGMVVVGLAGLFHAIGFAPARPVPSWWDSLLYTASSTLSISDDALRLTAWGKLLRILLRLLGPLLLGLALLSIRNRVKR
jgi:uncharacterized protein YjbI with pentapeptide repeats